MATLYELTEDFINVVNGAMVFDEKTGEIIFDESNLDDLEIALNEKLESTALFIKNEKSDITAIKAEEQALAARRKTKERKIEWLENYMLKCMESADIKKIDTPKVAISTRKSKRVEVTDEYALKQCAHVVFKPQPDKVDKTMLRKILNEGEDVAGAKLVENVSLIIK